MIKNVDWRILRHDKRTWTAVQARKSENPGRIPDEYLFIDNRCCFANGKIHEVILPRECVVIGSQAFERCQFQKEVQFPDTLRVIGDRAFAENHRLKRVRFPGTLNRIGKECYKECNSMTAAEFLPGSQVKVIPERIFDSCVRLSRVRLPEKTERIGDQAFYRCKELKVLKFPGNLKEIGRESFYFCGLEELDLPERLERIGESAFFRCKMLKTVRIPSGVKYIGRWAFHGCSRLEEVEILHDPDYIGEWIINKSCTIRCRRGSRVDDYCSEYGFKREYVSGEEMVNE